VPYPSAFGVMIHEEALFQVYVPLPFYLYYETTCFHAIREKRLNSGSPNLGYTMNMRHPVLRLIFDQKGQSSNSNNSKVFECLSTLLRFTRWHDHILITTRPNSFIRLCRHLLTKHCYGWAWIWRSMAVSDRMSDNHFQRPVDLGMDWNG